MRLEVSIRQVGIEKAKSHDVSSAPPWLMASSSSPRGKLEPD